MNSRAACVCMCVCLWQERGRGVEGCLIPEETTKLSSYCCNQLMVGLQGLAQAWLREVLVFWDLAQQQAHQNELLADHHFKAKGAVASLTQHKPY